MKSVCEEKKQSFWEKLGPGLITGVADDDPSGIATYSQTGAQFGFSLLWTMVFTFPFMTAIQIICARIGRVTGRGIAGNMRAYMPRPLLYPIVILLLAANMINIGADIGAMGEAVRILVGGRAIFYTFGLGAISILAEVFIPYSKYVQYLKWSTLVLLTYVATVFMIHVPWEQALKTTFFPSLQLNRDQIKTFIAILGTTISPYLFFWQASEEVEEQEACPEDKPLLIAPTQSGVQFRRIRNDTMVGMGTSNLIAFFIILTTALTLHAHGVTKIDSAAQAAEALRPIAGNFCFLLFSLGIIGTGLLAVPVLAGSAAYAVGEAMNLPTGLERNLTQAKGFYAVIAISILFGLAFNLLKIDPISALVWTAVINGVVAVPLMVVIMILAANKKVMGQFQIPLGLKILGWITVVVMAAATAGLFITGPS